MCLCPRRARQRGECCGISSGFGDEFDFKNIVQRHRHLAGCDGFKHHVRGGDLQNMFDREVLRRRFDFHGKFQRVALRCTNEAGKFSFHEAFVEREFTARKNLRFRFFFIFAPRCFDDLDFFRRPLRGGTVAAPDTSPTVEIRDLVLSRAGHRGTDTLVSCSFPAGSLTSVTGPSGAGKSTLLRVVAGLRGSGSGVVLVDGVDLSTMSLEQWQRRVVWLPQDPSLPGESVRDVVQMGDSTIDDQRILETMRQVGLDLDLDLDRSLGEGSKELSAGQRRRLALVRAIVRRPIVLLLDEPTAHLDDASAALVEDAINALSMTRIVATHRPMRVDRSVAIGAEVHHGL